MDDQERFRRAASAAGIPDGEISEFLGHLRVSIRLSGGSGGVPAGWFGGVPVLPEGSAQLPFVFGVDCALLPRVPALGLPADGSLLFQLDHENDHLDESAGERKYARVTHLPDRIETVGGFGLGASLGVDLPGWLIADEDEDDDDLSPLHRELLDGLPHRAGLRALAGDVWPGAGLVSAYLGGYADDEVITSFAEQTLAGREKAGEIVIPVATWGSHVEREAHRLAGEWVSLARFDLGDYYQGGFVIRYDDLAAGRWDTALPVTAFSE